MNRRDKLAKKSGGYMLKEIKRKKSVFTRVVLIQLVVMFSFTVNGFLVSITSPADPLLHYIGLLPLSAGLLFFMRKRIDVGLLDGPSVKSAWKWTWLLAAVLMFMIWDQYPFHQGSFTFYILLFSSQFFIVAFIEEVVYRGYLLHIMKGYGIRKAIFLSSFLFAVTHCLGMLGGQSPGQTLLQVVYAFVVGIALSVIAIRTQTLMIGMVFHALNNMIQLLGEGEPSIMASYILLLIFIMYGFRHWILMSDEAYT